MNELTPREKLRSFSLLWFGQVISVFGSGLTGFALGVWVYQQTGSVTRFTLIAVSGSIPGLLLSPFAGVLVDRFNRRTAIILGDLGAALGTVALIALLWTGQLEVWHIYVVVAFGAASMSIQVPAYQSSVSLLIPKKHFARANGMLQFGESSSRILAPLAAGVLLSILGLAGIITIDLVTFLIAVTLLLFVTIPKPPESAAGRAAAGSFFKQAFYGWGYISGRPGLLALALYFTLLNLLVGLALVLVVPLVLSFSTETQLGLVLSLGSFGMLLGSLLMGVWGGPKMRVRGILAFSPLLGVALLMAGLQPSVVWIAAGVFAFFFFIPVVNSTNQAVWQTHVEQDVQGRVFAMRRLIGQFTAPIAYLIAGPLADYVFEPLLRQGGPLAGSIGAWIGVGEGRGIALIFIVMGLAIGLAGLLGFLFPHLRSLDEEEPSRDEEPSQEAPSEESPARA